MDAETLYQIAHRHCFVYSSRHKEDIIQDAVVKAWEKFEEIKELIDLGIMSPPTLSYIKYRVIKNMQNALLHYQRKDRMIADDSYEDMEEILNSQAHHDIIISLPLKGRKREVVEAMILGNFELEVAAKMVGLCKSQTHHWWHRALKDLAYYYK